MAASWMVGGVALVVMVVMISSNSPSWQGARTKTSDPDFRFRDYGGGAEFFLVVPDYFRSFLVIRSILPEGGVRGPHGVATPPPGAAQGGGPPWARLRGSSGSKTLFIALLRIFPKVEFLHIKKTPKQFC